MSVPHGGPAVESAYDLLPGFISEQDHEEMVNGWNTHLEQLLLGIQHDSNVYFAMLTETAQSITRWKWVFIVVYAAIVAGGVITTGVALGAGVTSNWVPIMDACIMGFGGLVYTLMEALGMNEWAHECKTFAGDYIMLGRRIESQKRVPRRNRHEKGTKFANAASMRFEELRKDTPNIPPLIARRYHSSPLRLAVNSMPHLQIPLPLLDFHAGEDPGFVNIPLEEVVVDMSSGAGFNVEAPVEESPPSIERRVLSQSGERPLQEIFDDRLRMMMTQREDRDELDRYETWVRNQFSGVGPRLFGRNKG